MQIIFAMISAKNNIKTDINVILLGQLLNLSFILELLTIVKIFDKLIKQAKEVGRILHSIDLDETNKLLIRCVTKVEKSLR